ncbi:MAG: hypothetical protein M1820_003736 [Bogoriella megaspora]|nr:MAG: hypothetical protein M1820_003736 [Bogoriella megaspora]
MPRPNKTRGPRSWKPLDLSTIADPPEEEEEDNSTVPQQSFNPPTQPSNFRRPHHQRHHRISTSNETPSDRYNEKSSLTTQQSKETDNYNYNYDYPAISATQPTTASTYATASAAQADDIDHYWLDTSYDPDEVRKVFGGSLPGPAFLECTPGSQDGQVQFIQLRNGDISAHQWTSTRRQWTNLGQYSYSRKRIEGQLASDRIRGQSSNMLSTMGTLVYFREVAFQRDPNAGRPASGAASALRGGHDPTDIEHDQYRAPEAPQVHNPRLMHHGATQHARQPVPQYNKASNFQPSYIRSHSGQLELEDYLDPSTSGAMSHTARPTQPPASNVLIQPYGQQAVAFEPRESMYGSPANHRRPATGRYPGPMRSVTAPVRPDTAPSQTSVPQQSFQPRIDTLNYRSTGPYMGTGTYPGDQRRSTIADNTPTYRPPPPPVPLGLESSYRDMDESMSHMSLAFAEPAVPRTVLHDPFQASGDIQAEQRRDPAADHAHQQTLHPKQQQEAAAESEQACLNASGKYRELLRGSVRDDANTNTHKPPVYHQTYLDATEPPSLPKMSHREELDNWWDPRKKATEATEFQRGLKTAPFLQNIDEPSKDLNKSLMGALQQLYNYVDPKKPRDSFSRFGKPPEWSIDKSANGNKSYFGEDWGTPPSRVGRDPRYQPLGAEPRYAMYDEQERKQEEK